MRLWLWMWINASYVIICYVLMMLVMQVLCYMLVMQILCYMFMMLVMQITMINIDPLWHHVMQVWCLIICKFIYDMLCKFGVWLYACSYMTCYASLVFDYMQVTCASLHLSMICIHMQVNPFVCHTYICKFTPSYDISSLCKLPSLWHMWFMQVWVGYLC